MAQPTVYDVHPVDPIITQLAVSYAQAMDNFIALKVFKPIMQDDPSGQYFIFPKNDWFRDEMQRRAPGTPAEVTGFGLNTAHFQTSVFALKEILDQQVRAASQLANLERAKVRHLVQKYLIRLETQWATDYMTTGIWGTDYAVTNQWSNMSTGDPRGDVIAGKGLVLGTTGQEPNTMVVGYPTWQAIKQHPELLDQFKYTSPDSITQEMAARFFEIDNFLIARAVKATNREGETPAYSFVIGKMAWLGYVDPAPTPEEGTPTAGNIVFWSECTDGLPNANAGVTSWYDQETRADKYELQSAWTDVLAAPDLGVFYNAVVA
jgi:hypothetical protein